MAMNREDNSSFDIPTGNEQYQEEVVEKEGFTIFRGIQTVVSFAILTATLLTLWN